MAAPDIPVNIDEKLAMLVELWSPRIVGEINDLHVKVVRVEGEFVWHTHDDTDEFFLVRRGDLTIEMSGRDPVSLGPGDFFVVPRGVEHRPVASSVCELVLIEPKGVVNTGDATDSDLTAGETWI
jgi:mannose-6-phosphate isomerase-like protein (cupin superfamily)